MDVVGFDRKKFLCWVVKQREWEAVGKGPNCSSFLLQLLQSSDAHGGISLPAALPEPRELPGAGPAPVAALCPRAVPAAPALLKYRRPELVPC